MDTLHFGLKVDVCTFGGMQRGVPALLRLFNELGIHASFFIAFGPDHSGRAIRRVFRRGFLRKMLRTNAVGTYGWRTLLYGTLLPGPQIARSSVEQIRALVAGGHEVAMHGYDHVYWQDRLAVLSPAAITAELERARQAYGEIVGMAPQAFGAPGWQCTPASFASEDRAKLRYHSDTRGFSPFLPEMGGERFRTIEIPTTLPTLDETYNRVGTTPEALTAFYVRRLRPGWNVYTAHAEMEGIRQLPHLRHLLETVRSRAMVMRLADIAAALGDVPMGRVVTGPIDGRAGMVAWQEGPRG